MDENFEIKIEESTLHKMMQVKEEMGFKDKEWNQWFETLLKSFSNSGITKLPLENVMQKKYYDEMFDRWVQNFAFNLKDIWNEPSAKILDLNNENLSSNQLSAIVIGRGPSIIKNRHLEKLADSDYNGAIVCTDGALKLALESGVTPEKFLKYYVVTIDTASKIKKFYDDKIVEKYGSGIKGIFSTLTHPDTVGCARNNGIKIHWVHSLFDYHEGKKSFNRISALMVRAKKDKNGLPGIQTGGNAGTSSWFVSWKILKCQTVSLIGIDHSWNEDDPLEKIITHGYTHDPYDIKKNSTAFKKLYPKIYNPEFECNFILDPIFQYYSNALKDFIKKSAEFVTTINSTEGGAIFGEAIKCMKFKDFLNSVK